MDWEGEGLDGCHGEGDGERERRRGDCGNGRWMDV